MRARLRRRPQVYLWPTVHGRWWIACLGVIFLMGWGYANNLALGLAVLLLAVTVVLLLEAHFNLDGLTPESCHVEDQFAGRPAEYRFVWRARRARPRRGLLLAWDGNGGGDPSPLPVLEQKTGESRGFLVFKRRGHHVATHLRLESSYPLGLFRAWSFHRLDVEAWSWPTPLPGPVPGLGLAPEEGEVEARPALHGGDEPAELRRYVEGDPPARVAWKVLARGLPSHSRAFDAAGAPRRAFHWPWGQAGETERGRLAGAIHRAYQERETWSLRVGENQLSWDGGEEHHRASQRLLSEGP